jgi:hypothetical protein
VHEDGEEARDGLLVLDPALSGSLPVAFDSPSAIGSSAWAAPILGFAALTAPVESAPSFGRRPASSKSASDTRSTSRLRDSRPQKRLFSRELSAVGGHGRAIQFVAVIAAAYMTGANRVMTRSAVLLTTGSISGRMRLGSDLMHGAPRRTKRSNSSGRRGPTASSPIDVHGLGGARGRVSRTESNVSTSTTTQATGLFHRLDVVLTLTSDACPLADVAGYSSDRVVISEARRTMRPADAREHAMTRIFSAIGLKPYPDARAHLRSAQARPDGRRC